jgi:hypothetical protein
MDLQVVEFSQGHRRTRENLGKMKMRLKGLWFMMLLLLAIEESVKMLMVDEKMTFNLQKFITTMYYIMVL